MSGPLNKPFWLPLACLVLLTAPPLLPAKPVASGLPRGGWNPVEEVGGAMRLRRELRDSLPYEAQMVMSYPGQSAAAALGEGRGNNNNNNNNELFLQTDGWRGRGLGQALQQLAEDDKRRDQEAAYLAGLLRLLSEGYDSAPPSRLGGGEEDGEEEGGDFQGPYPPDYDDTEPGLSMAKPQAWSGLLDPQLTQTLLNRYRQERRLQGPPPAPQPPSRQQGGAEEGEEEVLRYLVGRVLSSLASETPQQQPPHRLARRDLGVLGGERSSSSSSSSSPLKRSRRSLDDKAPPATDAEPSLLRVKRLEEEEETAGRGAALQRMKRIDGERPQRPQQQSGGGRQARKRRALTFDPDLLAQRILQYLPD
ncbi:proprotein convertase subtilisin/kexin type 1 inhibitor, like [Amia ocellicauda]|uniref:proprotein convertase subtilisin/kexin type 1 inhibitor, like n=1 Tax=Amia ocellicauda TaxID=2972642 RepID=UPI003463EDC5